jgi:hypothetical protein
MTQHHFDVADYAVRPHHPERTRSPCRPTGDAPAVPLPNEYVPGRSPAHRLARSHHDGITPLTSDSARAMRSVPDYDRCHCINPGAARGGDQHRIISAHHSHGKRGLNAKEACTRDERSADDRFSQEQFSGRRNDARRRNHHERQVSGLWRSATPAPPGTPAAVRSLDSPREPGHAGPLHCPNLGCRVLRAHWLQGGTP